jgi:alcohol dehydrogenase
MYTRGVVFRTGRVNARAAIPAVLELVAAGRLRPELVTSATVQWDDAPAALASLDAKTVIVR